MEIVLPRSPLCVFDGQAYAPVRFPALFWEDAGALTFGSEGSRVDLVISIIQTFASPVWTLTYDLQTDDHEREGVYQKENLTEAQAVEFLERFRRLFEEDGRQCVGLQAPSGFSVILEDHGMMVVPAQSAAYHGDIKALLQARGYVPGELALPFPHLHSSHPDLTPEVAAVLAWTQWTQI